MISVLELGRCRVGQITQLHVVRENGRALCGLLVRPADLYVDATAGWEMWRTWRNRRCKRCEAEATWTKRT